MITVIIKLRYQLIFSIDRFKLIQPKKKKKKKKNLLIGISEHIVTLFKTFFFFGKLQLTHL